MIKLTTTTQIPTLPKGWLKARNPIAYEMAMQKQQEQELSQRHQYFEELYSDKKHEETQNWITQMNIAKTKAKNKQQNSSTTMYGRRSRGGRGRRFYQ